MARPERASSRGCAKTLDEPAPASIGLVAGTVKLIETDSGAVCFGVAEGCRIVIFQAATSVAVTSRQTAKRSAISVRHSGAEEPVPARPEMR